MYFKNDMLVVLMDILLVLIIVRGVRTDIITVFNLCARYRTNVQGSYLLVRYLCSDEETVHTFRQSPMTFSSGEDNLTGPQKFPGWTVSMPESLIYVRILDPLKTFCIVRSWAIHRDNRIWLGILNASHCWELSFVDGFEFGNEERESRWTVRNCCYFNSPSSFVL